MIYILGFCGLVAIFATCPRTSILFAVLIVGGLYFRIAAETKQQTAYTAAREAEQVMPECDTNCTKIRERILHRYDNR